MRNEIITKYETDLENIKQKNTNEKQKLDNKINELSDINDNLICVNLYNIQDSSVYWQ